MFYQEKSDQNLRFGDIIKGFVTSSTKISNPVLDLEKDNNYNIEISIPQFSVVLSPCCSIGPTVISVSPLIHILSKITQNPFFEEELLRINKEVYPKNQLPPSEWETLDDEEKTNRIIQGRKYVLFDYFIYDEHEFLPKYTLRKKNIGHYMVDFRRTHNIKCPKIKEQGEVAEEIKNVKILQLSVDARKDLRFKLAHFYERAAEEDEVLLKYS